MRETQFIEQNKEKWQSFEKTLNDKNQSPEALSQMFIQITDDLSYARTFYPNRYISVYLNQLGQKVSNAIHKKSKSQKENRFTTFWIKDLPLAIYESKIAFRLSLAIFLIGVTIGALSSEMDPLFVRTILGNHYVDMTLENIEKGDPMAVYKDKGMLGMALGITLNNIRVAFLTFVFGVFSAIGSIAILASNAIMVGSFQHLFYAQDVFWESFLTIWTHGTLEISAIVIAGAAGITMGYGLTFPGTLPRLKAFQLSARRGLKIMVGLVPIFILAGFIEGFITRYTEISDLLQLLFIIICLIFVLGYFVWYPVIVGREYKNELSAPVFLTPSRPEEIDLLTIKNNNEVLSDSFTFLRLNAKTALISTLGSASLFTLIMYLSSIEHPYQSFYFSYNRLTNLESFKQYFNGHSNILIPIIQIILIAINNTYLNNYFEKIKGKRQIKLSRNHYLSILTNYLISFGILVAAFNINVPYSDVFVITIVFPFLMICNSIIGQDNLNLFSAILKLSKIISSHFFKTVGLILLVLLITIITMAGTSSFLISFQINFLISTVTADQQLASFIAKTVTIITNVFFIHTIILFTNVVFMMYYHSQKEAIEGHSIRLAIQKLGQRKMIQGITRETKH